WCGTPATDHVDPGRRWRRSEHDDGSRDLAPLHPLEAGVDVRQAQAVRDQLVEPELAVEVGLGDAREIDAGPGAAVARAHDVLLAHEGAEAQRHAGIDRGLAEDDDGRARPRGLEGLLEARLGARRLEGVVRPAAAGE